MIVKSEFKGPGMWKYGLSMIFLKITLYVIWIAYAVIPQGTIFLEKLQESLNTGTWNLIPLVTPLGIIVLVFIIGIVVEFLAAMLLITAAKSELKGRF